MIKNKEISLSNIFATARIWAILSVVSAHMLYVGTFSFVILSRFGTIGVLVFLIMSGYYFRPIKFADFNHLLYKKSISLCVPWLFLGTLTWCYKAILTPDYRTFGMFLSWIVGNNSYLYYMSMLLLCFVLFYKAPKFIAWAAIPVNVISLFLTASGTLTRVISFVGITNYMNPFNWIGFFGLGMLLQSIKEEKIVHLFVKYRFLFIGLGTIAFVFVVAFNQIPADYFSYIAIPYELLGVLAVFSISTFTLTKSPFFNKLSNYSFSIYLIHVVFIGLLDEVLSTFEITRLISPVIIIVFTYGFLSFGNWVSQKIKIGNMYRFLLGIRK